MISFLRRELKRECSERKSRAHFVLEKEEREKPADAGTEESESKRFRVWLEHTERWLQSRILAGAPLGPPALSVCPHPPGERRDNTAGGGEVCVFLKGKGER